MEKVQQDGFRTGQLGAVRAFAGSRTAWFVFFIVAALALRMPVLGDWNFQTDDQFYALVGHRLLAGDTLYVDIWDRKGPALFYLYEVFALFGPSSVPYQLAGGVASGLAAFGIARVSRHLAGSPNGLLGPLLAGVGYLFLAGYLGGGNGQAEVFFLPLLVAGACAFVARWRTVREGRVDGLLVLGFLSAGLAGTVKQTAYVHGVYFGLAYVGIALRSGAVPLRVARSASVLALAGAAPLLAWILAFALSGHLDTLWSALVTSNMARRYMGGEEFVWRLGVAGVELAAPIGFALLGWLHVRARANRERRGQVDFVAGWLLASLVSILVYPNLFYHYLLIVLPALCVLAAGFYGRGALGLVGFAALAGINAWMTPALDWPARNAARAAQARLVREVRGDLSDRPLFVWGLPSFLYVLADKAPPSRLAFPLHLYDVTENGTSGLDQTQEIRRILAKHPDPVVKEEPVKAAILNHAGVALVDAYVRGCRRQRRFSMVEDEGAQLLVVYSDCSAGLRTRPLRP